VPSNSKGVAILFWLFAAGCIGGSIFVITRRNLIAAVMGMVGTFFAIAAVYAMLNAHFLAIIQILVYAGAIMVLFVFVVMILNRPEEEPWGMVGLPGKALAGVAMLYLLYRLVSVLWSVQPAPGHAMLPGPDVHGAPWGTTAAVGSVLFTDYLFPFEAISILLLIAVVGAIAIAHPLHKEDDGSQESRA
jgi:NADH-quinone oxidoreductase subunit J